MPAMPAVAKEKIGPLPVFGWVLAGAAVFGVVWYMSKHKGSGSASSIGDYNNAGGEGGGGSNDVGTDPTMPTLVITKPPSSPALTPARPKYVGKTAAELAVEPAGGWKSPPMFQQTSATEVRDATVQGSPGVVGSVNPANKLLGFASADGSLSDTPGPGRVAIWR
jgi:hypothetical protein